MIRRGLRRGLQFGFPVEYGRGRELWRQGGPRLFEVFDGLDIAVCGEGLGCVNINQDGTTNHGEGGDGGEGRMTHGSDPR